MVYISCTIFDKFFNLLTSWSIFHVTFLINSFVSAETQTEESTAEANYGSVTKSHLGYKCHVGNEELNWYLNSLLHVLCHYFFS
jgi:hypothetical protein